MNEAQAVSSVSLPLSSTYTGGYDRKAGWPAGLSPAHPVANHDERKQEIVNHINTSEAASSVSLPLFSTYLGNYDPKIDWLDGLSLKAGLFDSILKGCKILLEKQSLNGSVVAPAVLESIDDLPDLWKAMISVQKYGVIYLASREECRETFYPLYLNNGYLADQIGQFLSSDSNATRIINYAVHHRINHSRSQLEYPGKLVPPYCISSIGPRHFAVRACDFHTLSDEALLEGTSVLWDLHDFAHQSTATLSEHLFGTKYFSHLIHLPPRATALIRSPGMRTAESGPKISDGIMFSELLTGLFTTEADSVISGSKNHTYASMVEFLAIALADYLLGNRSLLHPSAGKTLQLERPIRAHELAVLAQNKAYELTASEIEQRVFIRGGLLGDGRDVLDALDAGERLKAIASNRQWLYFEVRNSLKHRAQAKAYEMVAKRMLTAPDCAMEEDWLWQAILDTLSYKDHAAGGPRNLWGLVAERGLYDKVDDVVLVRK
jgi:hypothetical protein